MSLYDCRQIGSYPTTLPLMRAFVDKTAAMEGQDGVLSVSIGHCFPYADVPELSGRILVVARRRQGEGGPAGNPDRPGVRRVCAAEPRRLSRHRRRHHTRLAINAIPVVMADPADNAGGGAPTDNTSILRRLIERGVQDAALGPIWDPIAVRLCFDAGLGATFPLRFGGKIGPASGPPVDADGYRHRPARDCQQSFGPTQVKLGDCAAIRVGGVEVVLITNRTQALGLELFRNVGIEPTERKMLVVKSTNHFMAAFGPIAKKVLYIDSDGPIPRDYRGSPTPRSTARSGRSTSTRRRG